MHLQMFDKVVLAKVSRTTVLAFEGHLAAMSQLVPVQCTLFVKCLTTLTALKRLLGMFSHVLTQIVLINGGVVTL